VGCESGFQDGGRIYAVVALEPAGHWISFKCSSDDFAELVEHEGVVPAPTWRAAQWVALETRTPFRRPSLKRLLRNAYSLVFANLTKKVQHELS